MMSTFSPKIYMSAKIRDLVYSGSRSEQKKSLFAKLACVIKECLNKLEANFSFYRAVGSNFSVVRPTSCRAVCIQNLG